MGLFTFFKRAQGKRPGSAAPLPDGGMADIRLRARRRLLGAVVLVLAAVVGLPLILETQPRPVGRDISIDVRRDGAAGAAPDSPLTAARPLAEPAVNLSAGADGAGSPAAVDALPESPALAAPVTSRSGGTAQRSGTVSGAAPNLSAQSHVASVAAAPQPAAPAVVRANAPQAPAPAVKPHQVAVDSKQAAPAKVAAAQQPPAGAAVPAPAVLPRVAAATPAAPPKPAATPRAEDRPPAKPATEAKPVATAGTRFVLQVGAFEHAAAARETRGKVEKLGLKAYEQEVDAAGVRRIRVRLGPFASREEAERMLQKLRAGGMSASVVPL